jgi:tRNA 2-thiouridine synthesizing protein D
MTKNSFKYVILIRCSPCEPGVAYTAWQFSKEVLNLGHKIETVFFYQEGVLTANSLTVLPQNELNITTLWQDLAIKYNIELNVCSSGALRRGIIDTHTAKKNQLQQYSLASGFKLTSLVPLVSATTNCDRIISFGP